MKKKPEQIKHDLELDERLDLHIKGWEIQRVGWVTILAIAVAGGLVTLRDGMM